MILANPEVASPLLRKAYREAGSSEANFEDRLAYARILAVLGDATGIETLMAAVDVQGWDKGWNYTGMAQYGASLSPLDSMIIALGRTRDRRALGTILKKAALLDAGSAFSHFRAVALALEMIGDPAAASPLAELLSKPGVTGHQESTVETARQRSGLDPEDNTTRSLSIREVALARALYRCGDKDGIGKAILERYTKDLRGHFARHASAVLQEPPKPRPD